MILHLLSDDSFSDYVIDQFENQIPGQNEYIVFKWNSDKKISFIKNSNRVNIIQEESKNLYDYCSNLSRFKAIITHNLSTPSQEKIVLAAPDFVKIAWVFWGFEVYNRKENHTFFLGRLTKKVEYHYWIKSKLKGILNFLKTSQKSDQVFLVNARSYQKVDYCLTHLREDYLYAKNFFKADFKFLWYNYFSIDKTLGNLKNEKINGNNILVGNSATLSNNHLEAFKVLKSLDLGNQKIIVPLSYGNNKYASHIIKKGEKLFGNQLMPLLTYIDRQQYNSILQSCSIVIMYHYRQQALGNIITSLWLGAKVYLSERTTTFSYFKRLGIHIYSIEKDLKANQKMCSPLPNQFVDQNRKILHDEYGKESMNTRIAKLITTLTA